MQPILIAPPVGDILTDAQLPLHPQIDADFNASSENVTQLRAFERAAVSYLDGYQGILGRCLLTQTWAVLVCASASQVRLPFGSLRDVAFRVDNGSGDWIDEPTGEVLVSGNIVTINQFPNGLDECWLHFTSGVDTASELSPTIIQIVKMLVALWDEDRLGLDGLPPMLKHLILSQRSVGT